MKKQLLLALGVLFALNVSAQKDETVLEIDGKKVTKSEFLQIYLKNNNDPKYDKVALDDYMELFKKFKLKVAEAEALGYDTIPKLNKELAGYRKQLAQPYLIDSTQNTALVKQAYDRMKNEIRASHILLRVNENATPEDTLRIYNRLLALKKRIENGEDFETVAKGKGGSEDPSVANNNGDLGYFTAFQMVFPFEEAAYNTPVGKLSTIVRTKFGYHLIKVTDTRPARGTMKAAHIMVATGKESTPEDIESADKKIHEIYDMLKAGSTFEQLASDYSDDSQTAEKGGELQPFGTGTTTRMVPEFEEAAFNLKQNGDISQPIRTAFGFHIIKRLDLTPLRPFDDLKKEIQAKVNKDERSIITQNSFIRKLKTNYGFKDYYKKTSSVFVPTIDSTYAQGKWTANKVKSTKVMFALGSKSYTQQDFGKYLEKNYRAVRTNDSKELIQKQYDLWQKQEILAYEESKLDTKYPEFKALMQEYHDGILLYEIMTDKVWNKAIKDTSGLKEYFAANNSKYKWGKRYDSYVYECSDAKIAAQVEKLLRSSDTISSRTIINIINKDSELNLRVRTGKFEIDNTPYLKGHNLSKGVNTAYSFESKVYVVKVDKILEPELKLLSESKGAATSDYQNYLEQQWLIELAAKHPIKVYSDVLYSLGK